MKHINFIFAFVLTLILTSCGTYMSSGGGGFWGGVSSFVDYSINEWEKCAPADSYDHTLIDAWKSGSGGKGLAIAEVSVSAIGSLTNKDVSALKNRIHNAASNLTNNEAFTKNDVNNMMGALFTIGDEFIDEYNKQKFEDAVLKLTDPNASGYVEEEALRVREIDYENRKIIWKSNYEYMQDLIEYRKSKDDQWIASGLNQLNGMSLDEYNNLNNDERQNIDLMLLSLDMTKDKPNKNISEKNDNPTLPIEKQILLSPKPIDYSSLLEGVVISDYPFNSYNLTESQMEALSKIAEILNKDDKLVLIISGHTCTIGSEKANYSVGLKRANTAKDYLVKSGINQDRIITESLGFSSPIDDNNTQIGRKHNRRLTFKIKD